MTTSSTCCILAGADDAWLLRESLASRLTLWDTTSLLGADSSATDIVVSDDFAFSFIFWNLGSSSFFPGTYFKVADVAWLPDLETADVAEGAVTPFLETALPAFFKFLIQQLELDMMWLQLLQLKLYCDVHCSQR